MSLTLGESMKALKSGSKVAQGNSPVKEGSFYLCGECRQCGAALRIFEVERTFQLPVYQGPWGAGWLLVCDTCGSKSSFEFFDAQTRLARPSVWQFGRWIKVVVRSAVS